MRSALLFLTALVLSFEMYSQVPRNVLVEHFTNTRCSICASRNPGFYSNLENFPEAIHLAIHPSSPYSDCVLNQHNTSENDARTNFYGIYGGTPRLVIQGEVISASANYNNAELFNSQSGMLSNYSLNISQSLNATLDSITVEIEVIREGNDALTNAWLYVALAESELAYAAPNGESIHYDVFRESLFGAAGVSISLPTVVDESTLFSATIAADNEWNMDELYAVAVLQDDGSNEVLQAESAEGRSFDVIAGTPAAGIQFPISVFPNPFENVIHMQGLQGEATVELFDLLGRKVIEHSGAVSDIYTAELPSGAYVLGIRSGESYFTYRLVKP